MRKLVYLCLSIVLLSACGEPEDEKTVLVEGKGGVYLGGVFKSNEIEDFRSLFPVSVADVASDHIAKQIFEGLVKQSQEDLTIRPSLSERLAYNTDGTVWTFHLHKGVMFHDDECFEGGKGREMNANDFKFAFDMLCTASADNHHFGNTFKNTVKGANEYYQSTLDGKPLEGGVSGVKVIDKYTLEISLTHPFAGFINILSTPGCWVYPPEAYEKYGASMRTHAVGTGPFKVKSISEGESIVLVKNESYWREDNFGNKLPYLDGLKFSFVKDKKSEFMKFKNNDLEMIFRLPVEMISEILGEFDNAKEVNAPFDIQVEPAMSIFFLGFQHTDKTFEDVNVRKAFNYAINRLKIVENILQGDGIPGFYGIVPPAFKSYKHKKLEGYSYDLAKAKEYMAKAGYPNGKGFPKITLQTDNGGGERNKLICAALQKMLIDNLNIEVELKSVPWGEHYESIENRSTIFWKSEWVAEYPDPVTFLTLLSSKHIPKDRMDKPYLNSMRFANGEFDALMDKAMNELESTRKRMKYYLMADQIGLDQAAIVPVFYDENYRLLKPYVKNFPANAMEYRDMSEVYFDKDKMEMARN